MKKTALILILFFCGMLLTAFEIKQINEAQEDYLLPVVVLSGDMERGDVFEKENLRIEMVQRSLASSSTFDDINEVVGKTLSISLTNQTIVMSEMLDEKNYFMPGKGLAITAIKFSPEEVMCWEIKSGEVLKIVHVDIEGQLSAIGDVIVKGQYDQSQSNNQDLPIYLLVEGKPAIIEAIIRARGNGRIEAVKNN